MIAAMTHESAHHNSQTWKETDPQLQGNYICEASLEQGFPRETRRDNEIREVGITD